MRLMESLNFKRPIAKTAAFFATGYARTLLVSDIENVFFSARDLNVDLDFTAFGTTLRKAGADDAHAVLSRTSLGLSLQQSLERGGWTVHYSPVTTRSTPWVGRQANADVALATVSGWLCAHGRPRTLVLVTGDGELGAGVAHTLRTASAVSEIHVVAFPHSCSHRLYPENNADIDDLFDLEEFL